MKYLFIVNPIAGGVDRTSEVTQLAEKAFKNHPDDEFEIYVTKCEGDDTSEVQRRADSGEKIRILSCGGDGTFNGCCNGAAYRDNISIAPFPIGTGNDFCKMFGDEQKLFLDLDAIIEGSTHKMDLINVNGTYCDCIASAGIDARVGTNVHNYTHLPLCHGPGAYVISLIVELTRGLTMNMKITADTFSFEGPVMLCCVCNARHYGGGFNPSSEAMPDDGLLDIVIAKKMHLAKIIKYIGKYASGRVKEINEKYFEYHQASELKIELEDENVINVDGEAIYGKTIDMKVCPEAINLIVPKGMTFFNKKTSDK